LQAEIISKNSESYVDPHHDQAKIKSGLGIGKVLHLDVALKLDSSSYGSGSSNGNSSTSAGTTGGGSDNNFGDECNSADIAYLHYSISCLLFNFYERLGALVATDPSSQ
jgi:hypothetical protein